MAKYLNIVVSGEVDAGKSTLIGRFLYDMDFLAQGAMEEVNDSCRKLDRNFEFAYLLDSFEEERENQLTIDTTQIICKSRKGNNFVFIDVPGHRELIKNMLSGSSYADIAILVVDASKSIEEQTKRHAFILKFLGIERIIPVLNKMDLVGYGREKYEQLTKELGDFLQGKDIKSRHFIPVSAKDGENLIRKSRKMHWYKGLSLLEALNSGFVKKSDSDTRFIIQDIYSRNGKKTAIGRIISGNIKKADMVRVLPINKEMRVKKIVVFNKNKFSAFAPESIGLELDEMASLARGQVLSKGRPPELRSEIPARIFCVRKLDTSLPLKFKCAAQESPARISQVFEVRDSLELESKIIRDCLEENDVAKVVISTERPLVVEKYKFAGSLGRFVLMYDSDIYAIGIISQY